MARVELMGRIFFTQYLVSARAALAICSLIINSGAGAAVPETWDFWLPGDATVTSNIDHGLWQVFLDQVVIHDDQLAMNLVRYSSVSGADFTLLENYLRAMGATDPRNYGRSEQLAYWINLYNAVTVKVVLDHPEESSIRDMGGGFFSRGPWGDKLITVAGEELTLDDIEHRILRPIWKDRRIHFALNCASKGCPELAATAYTANNLEAMLNTAEASYVRSARGVMFDANEELVLSSIFDWYAGDFAPDESSLLSYLAGHSEDSTGGRLRAYRGPVRYQYDWALNSSE
jgi:hypothetical protein